jgi:hypothetical protein
VSGTVTTTNESTQDVSASATLTATAQAPQFELTETNITISNTSVGSTGTAEINIENPGEAPLDVSAEDAFGPSEQSAFRLLGDTEFTVASGSSRTVTVGFTPETAGEANTSFTLETPAGEETISVDAIGTETDLSANRSAVEFGTVGLADETTETLTLTNDGATEVTINSVDVTGEGFSEDSAAAGVVLENGDTQPVEVAFAPNATGSQTGTVRVTTTGVGNNTTTVTAALTGTGRDAELQLDQQTVRPGVTVAGDSTTGSITLSNVGPTGTELTINELSVADDQFSVGGVSEGDTITDEASLTVTFEPAASADDGEESTELTLTASGDEQTFDRTIPVVGVVTAPEPTISSETVSIGETKAGTTATRTVVISNDGGEPYEITDITPDDTENISAQRVGPSEIVPGGESRIILGVNRSTPGRFDTNVTIETDATGDTSVDDVSVGVTGNITTPELTVATTDITFDDTATGSATTETVRIENTGDATLRVAQPTPEDDGTGAFRVLGTDQGFSLPAGDSRSLTLAFEPSATDESTASIAIEPQGPTATSESISVTGTGVESNASLNQSVVNFGEANRNETLTRSVAIENSGGAPVEVTSSSYLRT